LQILLSSQTTCVIIHTHTQLFGWPFLTQLAELIRQPVKSCLWVCISVIQGGAYHNHYL